MAKGPLEVSLPMQRSTRAVVILQCRRPSILGVAAGHIGLVGYFVLNAFTYQGGQGVYLPMPLAHTVGDLLDAYTLSVSLVTI